MFAPSPLAYFGGLIDQSEILCVSRPYRIPYVMYAWHVGRRGPSWWLNFQIYFNGDSLNLRENVNKLNLGDYTATTMNLRGYQLITNLRNDLEIKSLAVSLNYESSQIETANAFKRENASTFCTVRPETVCLGNNLEITHCQFLRTMCLWDCCTNITNFRETIWELLSSVNWK